MIPAAASTPGQMVRWFISTTDTSGNTSRFPAYADPLNSPAYLGTVIGDPALTHPLPVIHWFVQNTAATDTTTGTRCSVWWNGQFYDNVFCRVRGASAPNFTKKPYKFDFNPGDHFRYQPGQPRVDELNLNSTNHDKAYVRAPLTFETFRRAGSPACDAFNVRVQRNGAFFSVAAFVEQVDATFLERRGFDPNGALYKMFNGLTSSTAGVEKKTRKTENNADLQALVAGLPIGGASRGPFLFDNFDMPALINYLAAGVLCQDLDRTVKNYYLYRDSDGSRLWSVLPWDKDLTFGLFGLQSDVVSGNDDSANYTGNGGGYISHPLFGTSLRSYPGGVNNLIDAVYATTVTRQMFLRRLRTLMDAFLQPPGTPAAQLAFEGRLSELAPWLQPDATLDLAKWNGVFGVPQTLTTATNALRTNYLARRRVHLYQTHGIDNLGAYPAGAGIPHAQAGSPALAFGAIEFNPASANQAQEFVELINANAAAVDISGWRMEGAAGFTFAPGTVVPGNGRIHLSPDPAGFRTRTTGPRAGQGLLVVGPYAGQLTARGGSLTLKDAGGSVIASTTYAGDAGPVQQFLRLTELMVHPSLPEGSAFAAEEFEFIELTNTSATQTLNLSGVRLTDGVGFNFTGSAVTSLLPGARTVVVKNTAAFIARYGAGLPVAGPYTGALENQGERLQLLDAAGEIVQDLTYDDWFPIAGGHGFSMVPVSESTGGPWRAGSVNGGTPGAVEPPPLVIPAVVINEVLSRSDTPPLTDSVELFNPTANPAAIGGWFITDDFNTPKKFRIPEGRVIPSGGYIVFTEADFNPGGTGFAFSSDGDEAWLFSADATGSLTGYAHGFSFGAAADGVSFGRTPDSQGREQFVAQSALTIGRPNTFSRTGPVVISEIQYQPSPAAAAPVTTFTAFDVLLDHKAEAIDAMADRLEFVEIQNITDSAVPLFDPANPANTWRLRGDADFDFPAGLTLAANGTLLIVNFNPLADPATLAAFRTAYSLSAAVVVAGPFSGRLDNAGARVELQKPDTPTAATVPYPVIDSITYGLTGWPPASGNGFSLQRRASTTYGNDPVNWNAASPAPGTGVPSVPAPAISATSLDGNAFTIQFTTVPGFSYRTEISDDLLTWHPYGVLFPGTGAAGSTTVPVGTVRRYSRIVRVP